MFFIVIIFIFAALFILKHFIEKTLREDQNRQGSASENSPRGSSGPVKSLPPHRVPKVSFAWTWMQCAGKFGYTYLRQGNEHFYPSIEGSEGSCKIRIDAVPGQSGKGYDTVMSVMFPVSAGLGLCLVKGAFLTENKGKNSRKDTGEFFEAPLLKEAALFVEEEDRFRRDYAVVCEKFLVKNWDLYEDFTLTDRAFLLRYRGADQNPQRFEEMMELLVDAGQFFSALSEHAVKSAPAEEKPSAAPTEIRPDPQITMSEEEQQTGFPEESALPAEEDLLQKEEPPVTVPGSPVQAPAEKECAGENPDPGTVTQTAEEAAGGPDKHSLIGALWNSSFPGNAEKQLFEQHYKGKTVCWDGILNNSFPYSFDFVFGKDPGVKSSVELLEITQGNSSFKAKIKAIVSFPPEEAERLRSANGKNITFQGTLLKYEALSRELYLTDGHLLSFQDQ